MRRILVLCVAVAALAIPATALSSGAGPASFWDGKSPVYSCKRIPGPTSNIVTCKVTGWVYTNAD